MFVVIRIRNDNSGFSDCYQHAKKYPRFSIIPFAGKNWFRNSKKTFFVIFFIFKVPEIVSFKFLGVGVYLEVCLMVTYWRTISRTYTVIHYKYSSVQVIKIKILSLITPVGAIMLRLIALKHSNPSRKYIHKCIPCNVGNLKTTIWPWFWIRLSLPWHWHCDGVV